MGVNALYAALMNGEVASPNFVDFPESHRSGPDYLNVLQFMDVQEASRVWKR